MSAVYCAKCGSANRDSATFCDACGQSLTGVPAPTGAQPGVAASVPPPSPAGPGLLPPPLPTGQGLLPPPRPLAGPQRNPWLVPAIVALAVVAVAVGVGAYFMASAHPAQTPTAEQTPRAYVTAYYQAILDKDWQEAFDMQPAASKTGQTAAAFGEMQAAYGMVAFSIFSETADGSEATVVARMDLGGNGIWNATWSLTKNGGTWVATSRKVGLGEPGATGSDGQLPSGRPSIADTSTAVPGAAPSNGSADPTAMTSVPAGQTPRDYVAAYYQAILDKQWQKAFDMQPASSKAGQTVAAFQQTQEQMYGMTEFSISSAVASGSSATVVARQVLGSNGVWNATWGFVNDGGTWLVKTRKVAAGEPVT